eukprot:7035296-Pyramimonas_sp.AAC.1
MQGSAIAFARLRPGPHLIIGTHCMAIAARALHFIEAGGHHLYTYTDPGQADPRPRIGVYAFCPRQEGVYIDPGPR